MIIDFPRGVDPECIAWLHDNVGPGNILLDDDSEIIYQLAEKKENLIKLNWYFERRIEADGKYFRVIPTVTINDPKLATLFALRWA